MEFQGELHQVKLINFSVDIDEVDHLVPKGLKILQENGKAIVSMVDVQLKQMRSKWLPFVSFGYRHVAFRLLLDDTSFNSTKNPQGIFFLKSFSQDILLNWAGNIIGNYQLSFANIKDSLGAFSLKQREQFVEYALDSNEKIKAEAGLFEKIKRIDRAYSMEKGIASVTEITREEWPIQPVKCYHFATNFFKSAKFLGAFEVPNVIQYTWKTPLKIA